MSQTQTYTPAPTLRSSHTERLFVLDLSGGRVMSMAADGSDKRIVVTECQHPDGIVVDVEAGHIYWTNMGRSAAQNDGSIERADLDGGNRRFVVPPGGTFTPKQLVLDKPGGKLYWCDREGMRVMRANLDGTEIETLVQTGAGEDDRRDQRNWCVGIAIDRPRNQIYWTQKGGDNAGTGRILRAGIDLPAGQTPRNRTDIETVFDDLPEPIDLDIDTTGRVLYWTDRGNPPRGNSVNRASLDAASAQVIVMDLMEAIGLALDVEGGRMFATDLAGSIYTARLDGSEMRTLLAVQGNLAGVAYAKLPNTEN